MKLSTIIELPVITATLAFYLNNNRSNTTLLGITNTATPNQYVARNILI